MMSHGTVRFFNDTRPQPPGVHPRNGFCLGPEGGNGIALYDHSEEAWKVCGININDVRGNIDSCWINGTPGRLMPLDVPHFAFARLADDNSAVVVNFRPLMTADPSGCGRVWHPEHGFYVDSTTQKETLVGMVIRRICAVTGDHTCQGNYHSEWIISRYQQGDWNLFSNPVGSVSATQGWQPAGIAVETLAWADAPPSVVAAMFSLSGDTPYASLEAGISIRNWSQRNNPPENHIVDRAGETYGAQATGVRNVTLTAPLADTPDSLFIVQPMIRTNFGTMHSGAAYNGRVNVRIKF